MFNRNHKKLIYGAIIASTLSLGCSPMLKHIQSARYASRKKASIHKEYCQEVPKARQVYTSKEFIEELEQRIDCHDGTLNMNDWFYSRPDGSLGGYLTVHGKIKKVRYDIIATHPGYSSPSKFKINEENICDITGIQILNIKLRIPSNVNTYLRTGILC